MARKRRRFTAEFKARVALEALRERDSVQAIAARHELHPNQVTTWKRELASQFHRPRRWDCPRCATASDSRTPGFDRSAVCPRVQALSANLGERR